MTGVMAQINIPPDVQIDTLSGNFIIFQPVHGQRYTTDDVLVAWLSVRTLKESGMDVDRFLDLGSGLCSVPMIILWAFPGLQGFGIEISTQRVALGRQSLAANGLTSRFQLTHGDIRHLPFKKKFSFATSSPPYYKKDEGLISPNSDKAAVRFELQGSIEDYFRAASDHLTDKGLFVTVYPCQYSSRVFAAAEKFNFNLEQRVDVISRQTKPPLISLFVFSRGGRGKNSNETLIVRNEDQSFTEDFRAVRRELGFPKLFG